MSFHMLIFTGNLTRDPELRATPTGQSVCKFTVAVNGRQKEDSTIFIDCSSWGKIGESVAKYAHKGEAILCAGRIYTREFERNDGSKGFCLGCNCDRVEFISPRKKDEDSSAAANNAFNSGDIPF